MIFAKHINILNIDLPIGFYELEYVPYFKDLGLTIDYNLRYNEHLQSVRS